MIDVIISIIILAFLSGKEDGKWGWFIAIIVFFLIASIMGEVCYD